MIKNIKKDDLAVSAVIGVILMVAITVAIGAVVFLYSQGYIGSGNQGVPPTITWEIDQSGNTCIITQGDLNFYYAKASDDANLIFSKTSDGTSYSVDVNYAISNDPVVSPFNTGIIQAGDIIEGFENDETYNIIWDPLNIILGTITFN